MLNRSQTKKLPLNKHHPEPVGMNNDTKRYTTNAVFLLNYNCISPQIIIKKIFFHVFIFLSIVYSSISSPFHFLFPVHFFPSKLHSCWIQKLSFSASACTLFSISILGPNSDLLVIWHSEQVQKEAGGFKESSAFLDLFDLKAHYLNN